MPTLLYSGILLIHISSQLYSEAERQAKEALVNLMACYDLQFVQNSTAEGLVSYRLEPDLYGVTTFTGSQEVKQLSYSIKQMLAREVGYYCDILRRIIYIDNTSYISYHIY